MPKWFDELQQKRQVKQDSITAIDSVESIPEDASPEHGSTPALTIKKITPRTTAHGKAYCWLAVKHRAGHAFTVVVWDYQYNDLVPIAEGDKRELTVKVTEEDYTA